MSECGIELTIEELADRWEWLIETGFNKLEITEQFPKRGINKFTVTDLSMEFVIVEDLPMKYECAVCTDEDKIIIKQYSPLMLFLKDGLKSISLLPIGEDLYQERLIFADGIILIEKCNNI
jgi:hypothetical protein